MKVTIHAAKTQLSKLIARAQAGEEVFIARGNTLVARLVPIGANAPLRRPGALKGLVRVDRRFFEPLPDEELDAWGGV